MKRQFTIGLGLLLMVLCITGLAAAAEVSQGKCLQFDKEKKIITIEEYDLQFSTETPYGKPTGQELAFNVANALIGIAPEPGDILRFAYRNQGEEKMAIKVMNVSKQDLRKK